MLNDRGGESDPGVGSPDPLVSYRHKKFTAKAAAVGEFVHPPAVKSLEALDISPALLEQMLLKHLYISGTQRTDDLADKLCIPVSLLDGPITFLRNEALIEAHSRIQTSIGEILHLTLTDRGRERAHAYYEANSYVGPLPVSYAQYCRQVERQTVKDQVVNRELMEQVYDGLVIDPQVLRQIGAAFNSGNSIFLFGPAGTGKTFVASHMINLLHGDILIPYAVEAEGQIIRLYDPTNHTAHPVATKDATRLVSSESDISRDLRWLRCKRPVIVAAGELTLDMLELKYQPGTGFYDAPLQMRANGGLLLIDDLGRQVVNTAQLLNRWILPLENGVDYLSLHTGTKLRIPFDVIPVFSTNISPEQLADEAFLRRLGYKIHMDYISNREYGEIFQQYCTTNGLDYDPEMVRYLIEELYAPRGRRMTASHPKELINKVIDFSLFEGRKPVISKELLKQAWSAYFLN
ncbi:MAG: ATP-binding protein [Gammaproteobacteria bacterium]|nr:ATP-binding protein [Gammaproteobacteria bacterium]